MAAAVMDEALVARRVPSPARERVEMAVASTAGGRAGGAAYTRACLDDLARQLNARSVFVTYGFGTDAELRCGCTEVGSAVLNPWDDTLWVRAWLSPPWWTREELESVLVRGLGAGISTMPTTRSGPYVERATVTYVTLLPLWSALPSIPIRRVFA